MCAFHTDATSRASRCSTPNRRSRATCPRNDESHCSRRLRRRKNKKRAVGQELILSADDNAQLRMTVSAFDKAIAVLVTDGTTFGLFDVGQNAYVTGRATPDSISSILPVRLSALDLHRVLFGSYPTDELAPNAHETAEFYWDSKLGGYCYALPLINGATQRAYYSWPDKDIFRIDVSNAKGDVIYRYEASNFTSQKSGDVVYRFPTKFDLAYPSKKPMSSYASTNATSMSNLLPQSFVSYRHKAQKSWSSSRSPAKARSRAKRNPPIRRVSCHYRFEK